MAEVRAHHRRRRAGRRAQAPAPGRRCRSRCRARAPRAAPESSRTRAHRVRAPVAVDVEGEQMIGQVVAMRHAAEHAAHPRGGLLLVARALAAWCPSCQGGPDGVEHQLARRRRTPPSPRRCAPAARNAPCPARSSCRATRRASRSLGARCRRAAESGRRVRWLPESPRCPRRRGGRCICAQVDGRAHAERHRLAVQEARVAGFGFERVPEGVAEIEDAPQAAFALVGRNHFGLDAHRIGDDAVHRLRLPRQHLGAVRPPGNGTAPRSRIMPALTISYSPARYSRSGSVSSTPGSISTASGW